MDEVLDRIPVEPTNPELLATLVAMQGQPLVRARPRKGGGLALGFGQKVFHDKRRLIDPFYGEWEIGNFLGAWRIRRGDSILFGSLDFISTTDDSLLPQLDGTSFQGLRQIGRFDFEVKLGFEMCADYFSVGGDEDVIHIFGPNELVAGYRVGCGWQLELRR